MRLWLLLMLCLLLLPAVHGRLVMCKSVAGRIITRGGKVGASWLGGFVNAQLALKIGAETAAVAVCGGVWKCLGLVVSNVA